MGIQTAFYEDHAVLAKIPAASYAAAQSTSWVSMATFERVVALINNGLIAATGTFDAKLEQATSSGGAGAKDITGKAITQLAEAADDKLLLITCDAAELDVDNGFTHVRLTITPATAATLSSAILLGLQPRYEPVTTTLIHQIVS